MDNYRDTDIWSYIVLLSKNKSVEKIESKIKSKYKGTSIECNPIDYELDLLANSITKGKEYNGVKSFIQKQDKKIQNVFYKIGFDSKLIKMDNCNLLNLELEKSL